MSGRSRSWTRHCGVSLHNSLDMLLQVRVQRGGMTGEGTGTRDQRHLKHYFDSASRAQQWDDLYDAEMLPGVVPQDRQALALEWIERLALPAGTSALDVGSGPGRMAVALARSGFRVTAIDRSVEMRELAQARAAEAAVGARLTIQSGDAEHLDFDDRSFDLVVALGVLPYLADPQRALVEFARVTRAGGCVVVSSNNSRRLNRLLDPRFAPLLSPLRDSIRVRRQRRAAPRLKTTLPGSLAGATALHSLPELKRMITAAGMSPEKVAGVGFGLLTFMGRVLLRDPMSVRVHRSLQVLGSRGTPVIRSIALQHLVLARVG
jgi:ubiquinone/menaquinone biosynthesis C-methylase UbiE